MQINLLSVTKNHCSAKQQLDRVALILHKLESYINCTLCLKWFFFPPQCYKRLFFPPTETCIRSGLLIDYTPSSYNVLDYIAFCRSSRGQV